MSIHVILYLRQCFRVASARRLPVLLQRAHSPPCGNCSAPRGCARAAWRGDGQADRRKSVACHAAESGDVVPADWVDTAGTHKRPRQVFYAKKVRRGPFNGDNAGGEWDAEGGGGGMVRVSSEASHVLASRPSCLFLRRPFSLLLSYTSNSSPSPPLPHSLSVPRTHVHARPCVNAGHTGLGTQQMRAMVRHALDNPVGQPPLKERLQQIKQANPNPKILIAFDDVSVPLPPMRRPDVRQLIMEEAERDCVAAGITDIRFVCSIALHRYIRADEFRHICGGYLYGKYYPQRMGNYNAVDMDETVDIGVTRHGEAVQVRGEGGRGGMGGMGLGGMGGMGLGGMGWGKWESMGNYNAVDMDETVDIGVTRHGEAVQINRHYAEADLVVYANVNYVSMDGGYKSYATGLVHYNCAPGSHAAAADLLCAVCRSLFDPTRSALHKSFHRIGRMMQKHTDVFHVETVIDDQLLPFYASFAPGGQVCPDTPQPLYLTPLPLPLCLFSLPRAAVSLLFPFYADFVPELVRNMNPLQKLLMHSTLILFKVTAGETQAVHERTLAAIYRDKVMDIDGQADILILAPSALGPYTKDMYLNPLLVNTYALGYYYNMYVDGVPLLKEGGCVIVVNNMHYEWSSPAHDAYRRLFEEVLAVAPGLDEFERFQQQFVEDQQLNDIYRRGQGPAAVHGFYMYTWAAHGMDKVGKVYVVGAKDPRGPAVLRWEMADTIQDAVDQARVFLGNSKAAVTYLRCPPVGYVRVHTEGQGEGSAAEQAQGEVAQAVSKHQ
ncbi:unnamed protein product [Closterium sp. Naga37s-1]|nr:unnamed protein product [Closterium sp. Naga37s-1]